MLKRNAGVGLKPPSPTALFSVTYVVQQASWNMQRVDSLFIAPSSLGGRGVFTGAPIPKGSIIEISPMIVLPVEEHEQLDATGLQDYYFMWGEKDQQCAIALGYGSLYNHSFEPNAQYRPDFVRRTLDFFAVRDIAAGEEITVNYNGDPRDAAPVWFETRVKEKK